MCFLYNTNKIKYWKNISSFDFSIILNIYRYMYKDSMPSKILFFFLNIIHMNIYSTFKMIIYNTNLIRIKSVSIMILFIQIQFNFPIYKYNFM